MVASGRVRDSLALLRFRDSSFFISSFVHSSLSLWTKILSDSPVHSAFLGYLECGVEVHDIFSSVSRVPFKVKCIAAPLPLVRILRIVEAVTPFQSSSLNLFWNWWLMDPYWSGEKWGWCNHFI